MTESKLTKFSALFLALLTLLGTVFSVPVTAAQATKLLSLSPIAMTATATR